MYYWLRSWSNLSDTSGIIWFFLLHKQKKWWLLRFFHREAMFWLSWVYEGAYRSPQCGPVLPLPQSKGTFWCLWGGWYCQREAASKLDGCLSRFNIFLHSLQYWTFHTKMAWILLTSANDRSYWLPKLVFSGKIFRTFWFPQPLVSGK